MNTIRYKKTNYSFVVGIILLAIVAIPVIICFIHSPYDVNEMDTGLLFSKPSFSHIFGTDNFGRDIFARVMQGAAVTFGIAVLTVFIGAAIGSIIGALTGYYGGIIDEVLMRVNDGLASFPSILLALVVVSVLDANTLNICIALGIVFIPSFARIMRSEFLKEKKKDYVQAARLVGANDLRIMILHILPNTWKILLSALLVGINNAVLAEAGLSYLGLGVQPPDPSLGRMLAESQVYIFTAPWYVFSACLVMILAMLGLSLVGSNLGVSGVSLWSVKRKIAKQKELDEQREYEKPTINNEHEHPVIEVKNLSISYIDDDGLDQVINKLSFELKKDEVLGIVGESGSGKSLTSLAIMGLLPDKASITSGSIIYQTRNKETNGEHKENSLLELTRLSQEEYCKIRGGDIAMIFQEPMTSLDPTMTIGQQLEEAVKLHPEADTDIDKALRDVELTDVETIKSQYPHELSGGMRQRVMIAMALAVGAEVIIADEPTTALDADVAETIIDLFKTINRKYNISIILISHDLRVIEKICDRALIMQEGKVVEELMVLADGFEKPTSPYGQKLLKAAFADKVYVEEGQGEDTLVKLSNYSVYYPSFSGIFRKKSLREINHSVNLEIKRGDIYGFVGPSGSGKSTLVKAIAGLQKYTSGELTLYCGQPGMVFQDPYSSLNPARKVGWLLEEPLKLLGVKSTGARLAEIRDILKAVGLEENMLNRRVSELSGGQRQRISLAINLMSKQELIILDEPLSALDVTLQEQVLELLISLKKKYNLTYILISHDKRLVKRVCNKIYEVN